jgi:cell division protein FtsI (penicillin-binding protein 3)
MKGISEYRVRSSFLFFIFMLLYGVIAINLYFIQVWNKKYFIQLANRQYQVTVTNYPPRGLITDRHGKPLAFNKDNLSAFILPKQIEEIDKTAPFLKEHFPEAYKRLENAGNKHFVFVKRKLSPKEIKLIKDSEVADIKFIKESNRFYTSNSLGSLVGITNIDNKGQFGLEAIFDKQLTGQPTTLTLEKDARSGYFYFDKSTENEGANSKNIQLTIDKDLQFLAYEELKETIEKFKAKEGAVIVMDATNGNILSMAQCPTFSPNNVRNLDLDQTKNKLVTDAYEFGSVMKAFVALALLEEGVVDLDEIVDCEDSFTGKINGMKFTTVLRLGKVPFSTVFEKSNNIGIAKVTQRIGAPLYDYYLRLGFGKKTDIGLHGEQRGYITPPSLWSKRSLISLSFGYEVRATLLQLATAMSIISNDGYLVKSKILYNEEKEEQQKLFSHKSIAQIKELLHNTVKRGTAFRASIKGYNVMGKTGTANLLVDGKYSPNNNVYTFAGIIEQGNYKRVIVTFIKEPKGTNVYAATVAVPLFEKIAEKLLIHEKVINKKAT